VKVDNGGPFPDLDVQLRVLDSDGVEVASANPTTTWVSATEASGMNASVTFTAPSSGAAYTAVVRGTGQGDPAVAGGYSSYGSIGSYQVGLTVVPPSGNDPLALTVAAMPTGTVGVGYSATPAAAIGGQPPYRLLDHGLPSGLSIDPASGTVSGTPTTAGTSTPTFKVTEGLGATASKAGSVTGSRPSGRGAEPVGLRQGEHRVLEAAHGHRRQRHLHLGEDGRVPARRDHTQQGGAAVRQAHGGRHVLLHREGDQRRPERLGQPITITVAPKPPPLAWGTGATLPKASWRPPTGRPSPSAVARPATPGSSRAAPCPPA